MAPAKSPAPVSEAAQQRALDAYETLPLSFTPNAGQTDERVRYAAQGRANSLFFTDDTVMLSFAQGSQRLALELRFLGASPDARLEAGRRAAAGSTTSVDYHTTAGARDKSHNGGSDAFVTALRTTGHGITNLDAR